MASVDRFIQTQISSVPHLEALLLLWTSRPRRWKVMEVAQGLYIPLGPTEIILHELSQNNLIVSESGFFHCEADHPRSEIMDALETTYRSEVVRISTMIHAKLSPTAE